MEVKPGWKTTEFWSHVGVQAAIALLTVVMASQESLPPQAKGVVAVVGPILMGILQKVYHDGRVEQKVAAHEASADALADAASQLP